MKLAGQDFTAENLVARFMAYLNQPPRSHRAITRSAAIQRHLGLTPKQAEDLCQLYRKNPDDILR
ncbi:hypothetical protein C2U68_17150 [Methylomonas koyamae]|nr:hypothetical protein C2U68_17150 [Methylomonas koyamae]